MGIENILSQYPRCVARFDRDTYAEEFRHFTDCCKEELSSPPENAVNELFAFIEKAQGRKFGRASRIFDLRVFLCVYLYPAAMRIGTDEALAFAESVRVRWNEKYPQSPFDAGSYEDIASGFRTKPFGF